MTWRISAQAINISKVPSLLQWMPWAELPEPFHLHPGELKLPRKTPEVSVFPFPCLSEILITQRPSSNVTSPGTPCLMLSVESNPFYPSSSVSHNSPDRFSSYRARWHMLQHIGNPMRAGVRGLMEIAIMQQLSRAWYFTAIALFFISCALR